MERCDPVLTLVSGLSERRSKSGHWASLTIYSAIEPNTSGCQPVMPWVEITIMSIFSRSSTSMMVPATSLPVSTLKLALTSLALSATAHLAKSFSARICAYFRNASSRTKSGRVIEAKNGMRLTR
jgi:hypothetical protein